MDEGIDGKCRVVIMDFKARIIMFFFDDIVNIIRLEVNKKLHS